MTVAEFFSQLRWLIALGMAVDASPVAGQSVSADFTVDTRDVSGSRAAESAEFTINTLLNNSGGSGEVSVEFTVDTRGIDAPRSFAVSGPGTFTVDTRRFPNALPLTINGLVTDQVGTPVRGAAVKISQIGLEPTVSMTDNLGRFTVAGLVPSAYRLEVTAQFYGTGLASVDGSRGGTVTQQIQLNAALALLTTTPNARGPALAELFPTQPVNASRLRIWNRITGVWQESGGLNPSLPTVIMTHGWNSNSDAWAGPMAQAMVNQLGMSGWNIVAWDWREEAASSVNSIINGGQWVPSDKTEPQGNLAGARLYALLGPSYGRPIHFIGHSLGTLVNKFACDYLHAPGRWSRGVTKPHVTLLDEAELTSAGGVKVLSTPLLVAQESYSRMLKELKQPDAFNPLGIVLDNAAKATWEALGRTVMAAIDDWKSPIPESAVYVDNYVSAIGWNRSASANVCLAPPMGSLLDILNAHSYAPDWYRRSLQHLATVGMGFTLAVESGGVVPPVQSQYRAGSLWLQPPLTAFEFTLTYLPVENFPGACSSYTLLNIAAAKELGVINTGVDVATVTAKQAIKAGVVISQTVKDASEEATYLVKTTGNVLVQQKERIGDYVDAKVDQLVDLKNSVTADLKFAGTVSRLTYRYVLRAALPSQMNRLSATLSASAVGATPGSGVWITLDVPPDAALMAFDFGIEGDPAEDYLVAAFGGNNIFHLPGKNLVSGEIQTSDFINVSGIAGQRVEFYFGFHGGTSAANGIIEGLRFMMMPSPTLAMTNDTPGEIELHWSAAASGWQLEESENLIEGSWVAAPLPLGAVIEDGVISARMPTTEEKKFFRLRRVE